MKCQDFEKNIYLYSELTKQEKNQLQQHLDSCTACQQLFLSMQKMQNQIHHIAEEKMEIRNPALLTHKIMQKIASQTIRHSFGDVMEGYFRVSLIKYSFAVVSVILVMAFGAEFFSLSLKSKINTEQASKASVILNSGLFRESFSKQKEKRHSTALTECASPLRANPGYLACLKSKMK